MKPSVLWIALAMPLSFACSTSVESGSTSGDVVEQGECPDPDAPNVHYVGDSESDPTVCKTVRFTCDPTQTAFSDGDGCGCGCIDNEPSCPDPNDPSVHYVAGSDEDPEICTRIDFRCDDDQTLFSDGNGCGCGCIDNEPSCPDPNDPAVHYVGGIEEDPEICFRIDFRCEDDQTLFSDGNNCGCGCIDNPSSCPDPNDPAVHYIEGTDEDPGKCALIDFACEANQTLFSDECGCGCIDDPASCPDPNDPAVHYIGDSHDDPSVCAVVDFACEENQIAFSDACGCGCIDQR